MTVMVGTNNNDDNAGDDADVMKYWRQWPRTFPQPVIQRGPREACHGVRPKFWKFESISFKHNLNVVKSNDSTIGFHCCRSCCLAYLPSFQRVHFQCASWAPTSLHFSNGGAGWGGLRWTVGGNNMHTRNTHSFDTKNLYTLSVVRSSGVMCRGWQNSIARPRV